MPLEPMKRPQIPRSKIVDEFTACPYCGDEAGSKFVCCGESSAHFEEYVEYLDAGGKTQSCAITEIDIIENE